MVSLQRWGSAQEYEIGYWERQAQAIADGAMSQLEWYRWRAEQLGERLRALDLGHLADGSARVIEVGSGPVGVASFFPARRRVAVDPLADRYARLPGLTALRSPEVTYLKGVGEELPAETGGFDIALIENCIDHVRDIDAVMRELHRVLRPSGILYLTVNCRTRWGYLMHRTLSRLNVDRGHPHTFTPDRARRLLTHRAFELLWFETGSPHEARREDLSSPDPKTRLKGVLGVSEFVASAVARRR
ncbi:MAG TPA: class I SAM-dependent methyltransferase [Gemmatimonadales bacterium]|nr:class I SAM-dependent methyltransferase [Gemmatimonadales bacterium]